MDWTFEDNMVDGLFFCATLTGRRWDHIPFVQAGAETSDTGAEAVKPDPNCSRKDHSKRVCAGVGYESAESYRVVQSSHSSVYLSSAQSAARMLLLSDELMSCCAAGTNGCLD